MLFNAKNLVRKFFPDRLLNFLNHDENLIHSKTSFATNGEDLLLDSFLRKEEPGTYVDIGAHHPIKFSNTYYFYQKNWHGVNIDPNPESITLFEKTRRRDINILAGIGHEEQDLIYYEFDVPAVNTFNEQFVKNNLKYANLVRKRPVAVKSLNSVLSEVWPQGKKVDFLSLDVEGFEVSVLKSNDWSKFKFKFVIIEIFGNSLEEMKKSNASALLLEKGYILRGGNFNNLIFEFMDRKR